MNSPPSLPNENNTLTELSDWAKRSLEVGGPDTMWAYPYNYFGDVPYSNITLAFKLVYGELGDTVTIGQVMDTTGGTLSSYVYA
jgi:tyrosinase